jgi:peptidoglycan/LPS O-acetylase OafA/YrhL
VAALDGLRGVAAAVVVLHHWFNALAMPREARRVLFEGVLAPFVNGQGAVVLFFVLSGTVLTASLARGRAPVALPAAPANPAPAGAPWRRDSVRGRWSPMPRMPIECAAR